MIAVNIFKALPPQALYLSGDFTSPGKSFSVLFCHVAVRTTNKSPHVYIQYAPIFP